MTAKDDGNREEHDEKVGQNVADSHGQQLGVCLPTLTSRVGHDLPVVTKRLALSESADTNCAEGHYQSPADQNQRSLIGSFPSDICQSPEKFKGGVFQNPEPRKAMGPLVSSNSPKVKVTRHNLSKERHNLHCKVKPSPANGSAGKSKNGQATYVAA